MEDNLLQRICFVLVMTVLSVVLVDCLGGKSLVREGQIIDQVYVPAHTSWTTDSKGHLKSVYTADHYTIVVRTNAGIVKVDTNANGYYSVKSGQHVSYHVRQGCLTNHDWNPSL